MSAVLVSGAGGGLGKALVARLVAAGHKVFATDYRLVLVQELASAHVVPWELDVRAPEAWEQALDAAEQQLGGVDIVINNAGYLRPGYAHETAADEVAKHLDVNLRGVILGTQAAARRFVAKRSGHVINIGSLASLAPAPGLGLYVASKFGVRGYSLAVARELLPHGVYVSVVCPDAIATPMLDLQVSYDEAALTFSGARTLSADEVAACVVGEVIPKKLLEVSLPKSRGLLAKLACVWPQAAGLLENRLRAQGRAKQARLRQ